MVNGYRGVGQCVFPCTAIASKTGHLPLVAKTQAKICSRKRSATRTVGIIKVTCCWKCSGMAAELIFILPENTSVTFT